MSAPRPKKAKHNWYPPWAPRFWSGMRFTDVMSLLRENRFQIHPSKYAMTVLVSGCSVANSMLGGIQNLAYARKIAETELVGPPVFVIGHWRSGTTLMHELLALDPRMSFPSNFDAFVPHHFLVSKLLLYPIIKLLIPSRRPMDDMQLGVASPQEDDFALISYGAPTPYRRIAFPNRTHRDHMLLDISKASDEEREKLENSMQTLLKALTVRYKQQLVLKSPPHTGRISELIKWFPDAKFVHLSRHPYKLVTSTMRLWKALDAIQGFQPPRYDDASLKNYIFECKDLMYDAYLEQRKSIPASQLVEIRFEDLVGNPEGELCRVYEQLELEGFDQTQPLLQDYFQKRKNHKINPFEIEDSLRLEIDVAWHDYMEAFGYGKDQAKIA